MKTNERKDGVRPIERARSVLDSLDTRGEMGARSGATTVLNKFLSIVLSQH